MREITTATIIATAIFWWGMALQAKAQYYGDYGVDAYQQQLQQQQLQLQQQQLQQQQQQQLYQNQPMTNPYTVRSCADGYSC